jgi:outer membrane immunogenic protein
MGMIVNRLLQTGVAFITLLASPVLAADMAAPLPPPVAPAFSWTGVYFGLNAGWLGADNSMINQATPGADSAFSVELATLAALSTGALSVGTKSGFIGGAELGYNYQINNWVAGIEADIQGIAGQAVNGSLITASGSITSTLTGSMNTRWLGTLRGRLGFLPTPTLLVYGTGGLAYGEVAATTTLSQSDTLTGFSGGGIGGDGFTQLVAGWTAGGGVEWMFAQNWSAKIEFLHYDLGTTSFTWVATDNNTGAIYQNETTSVHNQGNIVRVGLNCLW